MAVYQDLKSTKDGRSWYFKTYKDGKQIKSKKYRTKKEAIDEEALFILKRDLPYNKNFSLVAKDYFNNLTKIRKESTIYAYKKDYNNHIHDYFKNMNISSISIKNIREWAEILEKKGLSVCYMNKIHFILNKIFDFAISNYDLTSNPSKLYGTFKQKNDQIIKDEDKVRYITKDEFDKFISVIDDNFWKTFFMFLYYSGVRKGEALALTWEDFRNDEIVINKTLYSKIKGKYTITSTKTNKNRIIKLNKTMLEQLNNYKNEIMKYTDFSKKWFIFGNSRFLPLTTIDRYKHKYFELSGINEISIHEFRHSHVSLLINEYIKTSKEKNMKIDTAKFFLIMSNRMGHSIQVMQETYMHLFPTIQDEIVDLLDNL